MTGLGLGEKNSLAIRRVPGASGSPSTDGVSGVRAAEGDLRQPSPSRLDDSLGSLGLLK